MDNGRTVYLIRHGESRYNAGVKQRSLLALVGEKDHGLSQRGVEQCLALRARIQERLAVGDEDALAISGAAEALSSPLRRALQTAHLALGSSRLVALADGREHCAFPVLSRDSVGTRRSLLEDELKKELPQVSVDVSSIDKEVWWTVAERSQSVQQRLNRLLLDLHQRAEEQPAVFVGHSRAIREIFRQFAPDPDGYDEQQRQQHHDFKTRIVENCAVVKLKVGRSHDDDSPVVLDARFVFDSSFRERYLGEPR